MTEFLSLCIGYLIGWLAGRSYGRRTAAPKADRASERQLAYLQTLADERKGAAKVLNDLGVTIDSEMLFADASRAITALKKLPERPPDPRDRLMDLADSRVDGEKTLRELGIDIYDDDQRLTKVRLKDAIERLEALPIVDDDELESS